MPLLLSYCSGKSWSPDIQAFVYTISWLFRLSFPIVLAISLLYCITFCPRSCVFILCHATRCCRSEAGPWTIRRSCCKCLPTRSSRWQPCRWRVRSGWASSTWNTEKIRGLRILANGLDPQNQAWTPYEELKIGGLNQQKHNSKNCCFYAGLCM